MKRWRPEDWRNPYPIEIVNPIPEGATPTAFSAFEEGADAMLKALSDKDNAKTPFAQSVWRRYFEPEEGIRVFIPDDKEEGVVSIV